MSWSSRVPLVNLDALSEVANVAAGHAATALSRLTDRAVMITVPDILLVPMSQVPRSFAGYPADVLSVQMQILGPVTGQILFLMPTPDARALAEYLIGRAAEVDAFEGMIASCLQETGNILAGAYTQALARMTGDLVMLSVPRLRFAPLLSLLSGEDLVSGSPDPYAFCVATTFRLKETAPPLDGRLLLMADPDALTAILDAVRLTARGACGRDGPPRSPRA